MLQQSILNARIVFECICNCIVSLRFVCISLAAFGCIYLHIRRIQSLRAHLFSLFRSCVQNALNTFEMVRAYIIIICMQFICDIASAPGASHTVNEKLIQSSNAFA